jgi:hypothetical protein
VSLVYLSHTLSLSHTRVCMCTLLGRAAAIKSGSTRKRPKALASASKGKGKHGSDESAAETSEDDDDEVIEVKAAGRDNTPRHMFSTKSFVFSGECVLHSDNTPRQMLSTNTLYSDSIDRKCIGVDS